MWKDIITGIVGSPLSYYNEEYKVAHMSGDAITGFIVLSLSYFNEEYGVAPHV